MRAKVVKRSPVIFCIFSCLQPDVWGNGSSHLLLKLRVKENARIRKNNNHVLLMSRVKYPPKLLLWYSERAEAGSPEFRMFPSICTSTSTRLAAYAQAVMCLD